MMIDNCYVEVLNGVMTEEEAANYVARGREKYGANDVLPGLTGWAQINGRDELEIFEKARLDGDYTAALNAGHFKGLAMDIRCFFRTFRAVLRADGVVEGGTGAMEPENRQISDGENVLK